MAVSMGCQTRTRADRYNSIHTPGAISPEHAAGERAGMRRIFNHDGAIDQDRGAAPRGILMRPTVSRAILEIGGIEDRYIRAITLPQETAVDQFERACGSPGHLVHGKLERDEAELPDIMPDDAREGAVEARMRHALADGAVRRDAIAIRSNQRRRRAH